MKGNTKHELRVSAVIVIAAALTGILTYLIVYMPENEYAQKTEAFRYSKPENKTEVPIAAPDNWADEIIQSMRENRARYRACHEALCRCVGTASFAVPAVDRLVKNHPELISEITDLWTQYYVSDAGCCEIQEDDQTKE